MDFTQQLLAAISVLSMLDEAWTMACRLPSPVSALVGLMFPSFSTTGDSISRHDTYVNGFPRYLDVIGAGNLGLGDCVRLVAAAVVLALAALLVEATMIAPHAGRAVTVSALIAVVHLSLYSAMAVVGDEATASGLHAFAVQLQVHFFFSRTAFTACIAIFSVLRRPFDHVVYSMAGRNHSYAIDQKRHHGRRWQADRRMRATTNPSK